MHTLLEQIKSIYLSCVKVIMKEMSKTIYTTLEEENLTEVITLLKKVERKEPGYKTIIAKNWSTKESTNTEIITWLRKHNVNVYSPETEIDELKATL